MPVGAKFSLFRRRRVKQLIFLSILLFGCQSNDQIVPEHKVLAKVNHEVLSEDDVLASIEGSTNKLDQTDLMRMYSKTWIQESILAQEAERLGYTLTRAEEFQMENLKKTYLINHLMKTRLDNVAVTEVEISRYYDEHRDEFKRLDTEYHLIHLFLPSRIRAIQDEIFKTKDILGVIKKFHLTKTVNDELLNGDLGYVLGLELTDDLKNRVEKAQINRIYGPIRIDNGYHFFQVKERLEKGTFFSLDSVRSSILERIYIQKVEQAQHDLVEELKPSYSIENKY